MLQQIYHHADRILETTKGHVLWLGDVQAAENVAWIKQNNIKTVLTAAAGFAFIYDPAIKHFRHELEDKKTQNISSHFEMAAFQIQKSYTFVTQACEMEAYQSTAVQEYPEQLPQLRQSSTLVIAYLIKYRGMSFQAAVKFCKAKRPQVCPNLGFQLQLKAYQKMQGSLNLHPSIIPLQKQRQKSELPPLEKQSSLNTTFHRKSSKISDKKATSSAYKRESSYALEKTLKEEDKQRSKIVYLQKMAQFRFGITNMEKWRIHIAPNKQKH